MAEDRIIAVRRHIVTEATSGNMSSPLTTHVLDTASGQPASEVPIIVYRQSNGQWLESSRGVTNDDGRCPGLLTKEQFPPGLYKITFDTKSYFTSIGVRGFYPYVDIVFQIDDPKQHYHVPLLLSPFGYSTYRGS